MTTVHDLRVALFNDSHGFADPAFSSVNLSSGEHFRVSWADGTPFVDDHVEVCEPEPLVFLLRGWTHNFVVTLKADASSLPHLRGLCRPTRPDDVDLLARIRATPTKEIAAP